MGKGKRLTETERRRLADWEHAAGYTTVADQELGIDSHGCMVVLIVVRREDREEAPLLGFTYRYSSEQNFFEDDSPVLVKLEPCETTVIEYYQADGEDWSEYL